MPHIDAGQAITLFVGNLPTFLAVVLAWMHSNSRISGTNSRIADLDRSLGRRIDDLDRNMVQRIDDTRDLLRSDFRRVEEV